MQTATRLTTGRLNCAGRGGLRLLRDRGVQRQRDGVIADDARVPFALATWAVEADDALCRASLSNALARALREKATNPAAALVRAVDGVVGQHDRASLADGRGWE